MNMASTEVNKTGEVLGAEQCAEEELTGNKNGEKRVPASDSRSQWFDPKRIFMNGGSGKRARSESVPTEPILNNNAR